MALSLVERAPYGSLTTGCKEILAGDRDRAFSTAEIALALGADRHRVSQTLQYLYKLHQIKRIRLGVYQWGTPVERRSPLDPAQLERVMREGPAWAILHLLATKPKRWWRPAELRIQLDLTSEQVRNSLYSLTRHDKLERKPGRYRINPDLLVTPEPEVILDSTAVSAFTEPVIMAAPTDTDIDAEWETVGTHRDGRVVLTDGEGNLWIAEPLTAMVGATHKQKDAAP